MIDQAAFIHPEAHAEGVTIGRLTRVWQFASVIRGAVLGEGCTVASGATVDGAKLGDRCIVCHNVLVPPGVIVGDDVFIGPGAVICNDAWPAASKDGFDMDALRSGMVTVRIADGASIGANSVVLPGVTIGERAMIAAGAVVDQDVAADCLYARDGRIRPIFRGGKRMRPL